MNNQETNQTVEPVTDIQNTPVTPVADNKPAEKADNTQDTAANAPVAPAVPDSVKLDLSADQAEMVQDLLSNFTYAYRSDREVDYKRELVPKDKVGKYPYVAEPADSSIINPVYDWVNKKWYSKSGSISLPEISQTVKTLRSDQLTGTAQTLVLTKSIKDLSESQANQNKLLVSMQKLMLTIAGSQKIDAPASDK
ncbi:hypothetical protein AAA431_11025 [Lactobacillus crispatus]|uniref:hypothetical protein n=1 Tax=Lactobacillus crispatus TaxID=47770 RepID=UPI0030F84A43